MGFLIHLFPGQAVRCMYVLSLELCSIKLYFNIRMVSRCAWPLAKFWIVFSTQVKESVAAAAAPVLKERLLVCLHSHSHEIWQSHRKWKACISAECWHHGSSVAYVHIDWQSRLLSTATCPHQIRMVRAHVQPYLRSFNLRQSWVISQPPLFTLLCVERMRSD